MVRAILAGQKTQTRRVVKGFEKCGHGRPEFLRMRDGLAVFGDSIPDDPAPLEVKCPYGRVGDVLWVREGFGRLTFHIENVDEPIEGVCYRADRCCHVAGATPQRFDVPGMRWRPSIHMPRSLARIVLRVDAVTVARVQAIDELDALSEGCIGKQVDGELNGVPGTYVRGSARGEFRELWDTLNAKRGYAWATNPWVWVVAFRRAV